MKTLLFCGLEFTAEKITKIGNNIIGTTNGKDVFSLKGISDFSTIVLKDGASYDVEENKSFSLEKIRADIDYLALVSGVTL